MSNINVDAPLSKVTIQLFYRIAIVAVITSILTTPIALLISYKISLARYDRIVDRQIVDFTKMLFGKISSSETGEGFNRIIEDYVLEKSTENQGDAYIVYLMLTDEFDQTIGQNLVSWDDRRLFSKQSVIDCINSYFPIMTIGESHYLCTKSSIVNYHTHYNGYTILLASRGIISDFITNAICICALSSLLVIAVSIIQYYVSLRVSRTLVKANVKTLLLLGNTIALRDNDTFHHNLRVMIYSYYFGKVLSLPEVTMNELISGALLHDLGKIGIPDAVLQKPGRLTKEEFDIIKGHVNLGVEIIINSDWSEAGIDVIRYHHEKYDGTGYPQQTKGDDIPLIGRIFAIVDVFDAITSSRPYKEPNSYEDTMVALLSSRSTHFDPYLVDQFIDISRMLYEKYANRKDSTISDEANRILNVYYG